MCHIIWLNQWSARYGLENLDDDQVNSFENLIVMCWSHHKMIDDDPNIYTPEILRKMKLDHENKNQTSQFAITDDAIDTARDQYITNNEINISKVETINVIQPNIAPVNVQKSQSEIDQEFSRIDKVFFWEEDISNFQILKFISQPMTQDAKIRKWELEKIFKNAQVKVNNPKKSYIYPQYMNHSNYEYKWDQFKYKYITWTWVRFYSLIDIYGNLANYCVFNSNKIYIHWLIEFLIASFMYTKNTHQAIIWYKNTIALLNFDNSDDWFMEDESWFTSKYICETVNSWEIRNIYDAVKIVFNDFSVYTKDTSNDKINFDKRIDECSKYFSE